ncbi:DUF3226 domain-containing protein [Nodularia sp. NIES-3585]|uniref:DUF3226 domain-containing protein n=1 Tax=Nodularia sp. NIES-3585 TaxID=1973477 RepID=UPI000B5CD582|nr:DUF3226 domain-containing protein [Nodularia sp. NIES-3585]GAX35665.1 hypothetical protein NIES3585_16830 [Nodularia sp. NIES-3585]
MPSKEDKSTKRLIVEGEQDKRVIPYLIEANGIPWKKGNEPVYIQPRGGNDFSNYWISARLKEAGLTHLGLILDADDDSSTSWQRMRDACLPSIRDIPQEIPETGLIHITNTGIKFGIWIMPDNRLKGMLETFLAYMISDENQPLWKYAQEVVEESKNRGAEFISFHHDKACIYTWLAWQNPPGRQLHNAIEERILHPQHPNAQVFVNWFRNLYDL